VLWKPLLWKKGRKLHLCKLPSDFNKKSYGPTRNPTCDEGRCDYELRADYVKSKEKGSGFEEIAAKR
jgi:hypothetical protein